MDGRACWMLFEELFNFIGDEIHGRASRLEDLEWGKETQRLVMAPHFIWDVRELGQPQPLPAIEDLPPPALPEGFVRAVTSTFR